MSVYSLGQPTTVLVWVRSHFFFPMHKRFLHEVTASGQLLQFAAWQCVSNVCVSRIQALSKAVAVSGAANGSGKRNDLLGTLVAGMAGIYAAAYCSAASDNKAGRTGRIARK